MSFDSKIILGLYCCFYFYFLCYLGLFPNAWGNLSVLDTPEYHSMSAARKCKGTEWKSKGRKEVLENRTSLFYFHGSWGVGEKILYPLKFLRHNFFLLIWWSTRRSSLKAFMLSHPKEILTTGAIIFLSEE